MVLKLFKPLRIGVGITDENINFLNGNAWDLEAECKNYENRIKAAGGIDIQLLGIGSNGHIAFNEPADAFQRWSHVVSLKESTIADNSRFFDSVDEVPTQAITMGIGSIMQAKRILIIAIGEKKAKAIKQVIDGNVTPGAFQMNVAWYYAVPERDPVFEEHCHDSDEIIGFFGCDPEDPYNLHAEIEITINGERHLLTKSTMIFAPAGLPHMRISIKRVDRPVFHFSVVTNHEYIGGAYAK